MNITKTTFAPRTYLVWRKEIEIKNVTDREMWQTGFGAVHSYIEKNGIQYAGSGSALYFTWDEESGKTELGIGNPVEGVDAVDHPDLSLVPVTESKAMVTTVKGDYGQLREAHTAIAAHAKEHNITTTLAIEEYTVTGMDKPDSKDWETNIYYLYE